MSPLHQLAGTVGLQIHWQDAAGRPQTVSDYNLCRILAALGYPAQEEAEMAESASRAQEGQRRRSFVSTELGVAFQLPPGCAAAGEAELMMEDGHSRTLDLEQIGEAVQMPAIDTLGYHRLRGDGWELTVAVAPRRCIDPQELVPSRRLWGPAVQISSLRQATPKPFGDFGTLAEAARLFGEAGADLLAVSPTHALFPADPQRFSPYSPSSRLFHNVLLADLALVGHRGKEQEESPLIDWEREIPRRMEALRQAFAQLDTAHSTEFTRWREAIGAFAERQATHDALHEHFWKQGVWGWHNWPEEYRSPLNDAVTKWVADHQHNVAFYSFAQWLAEQGLASAQRSARDSGMVVGLVADLAVGLDPAGADAWSRPGELLHGLSVGAPPDLLGPDGQDWGLTTLSPAALQGTGFAGFIATIRAALRHAGGIRIDHALGLNRLWVIPCGGSAADGAYLNYPLEDMLRILAIESHRANAIVIGEDLGTVPEGLRPRLEDRNIQGMRVLPFERRERGEYIPPGEWQRQAVAMTGTHDTATIAGWWQGRDIDWTWALGRSSSEASEEDERRTRATERAQLWQALTESGATAGVQPDIDEPGPVLDAAITHVGSTPCELAIIPLEDLVGCVEQPNLPGTIDEHPNWRRRMPAPTGELLDRPDVARRIALLREARA